MDRTHLRFFTLVTARDLIWSAGFNIIEERFTTIPFPLVVTLDSARKLMGRVSRAYHLLARAWPRMFAYQFVIAAQIVGFECEELKKLPIKVYEDHPHLDQ